jgi:hypothetical protein
VTWACKVERLYRSINEAREATPGPFSSHRRGTRGAIAIPVIEPAVESLATGDTRDLAL